MKKLLLFALLLALASPAPLPALAQCYKTNYYGGTYVAPVAPPKTYTTYTTYTVPSYNYNSNKSSYTPSSGYSAPSYSSPRSSRSYQSSSSEDKPARVETRASSQSYLEKMKKAYWNDHGTVLSLAENVRPAELTAEERSQYYYKVMHADRSIGSQYTGTTTNAKSVKAYEECLRLYPESATDDMHLLATECYYFDGDYKNGAFVGSYPKGIQAYDRCKNPVRGHWGTYYCGLCHAVLGQYDQALALLNSYLEGNSPTTVTLISHDFFYQLALCQLRATGPAAVRTARYQQALTNLATDLADESQRGQHDAATLRSEAYFKLADYAKCIENASEQLAIKPGNTTALTWRAQAHTALKQYPEALVDREAMTHYEPGAASTWSNIAWAQCLTKDFAGAIANSREALRRDSTTAASFLPRGWARAGLGQWAGALADYNRSLALDPKSGLAYLLRAQVRLKQNQKPQAKADLQQAVKLGVEGHPTLTTADARQLLTLAGGSAAPAGRKPTAPARPAARPAAKARG